MRKRPPDLQAAIEAACAEIRPDLLRNAPPCWAISASAIAVEMEAAAPKPELAYHNRQHTVEVVHAMGWLCATAHADGLLDASEARLGVVAMIGHDIAHDGSPPEGGRLERLAAERVDGIVAQTGLSAAERAAIASVVRGTDPAEVGPNMARVAGEQPVGPLGRGVDLLRALANEADVFASLLPRLGWDLSELLAEEWRGSGHAVRASRVVGFAGRLSFLRVYSRFTGSAARLGLATLQANQVAAFATAAGLPPETMAEEAALLLDAMPNALARERYNAALATGAASPT